MINATFTGNVYDENFNLIDCYYDVYYLRQNILITGLRTELNQYNFNAGDTYHLTQNGDLKENDIILIRFNTNSNTLDYTEKFSSTSLTYINESITVKDVQLRPIQFPQCYFNITEGTINNPVLLEVNKSLDNSWLFNGSTMYQREYSYSYNIFPGLEILDSEILYDFDGFWITNNTFSYDEFGFKTILYQIQMKNGEFLTCSKEVKITKNTPTINHISPQNLVIGSEITIETIVTDFDGTILNIKHYFDYNLEEENTNLLYSYNKTLTENKTYMYKTEILWNNGFEDLVLEKISYLEIQNQKPEVNPEIEYINNTKNNIKIIPNAIDPENDLNFVRYKIYIRKETIFELTNETEYTWVYLDTLESNILDLGVFIDFYKSGNFKIDVQAFDNGGLGSDIKELFIDIECSTTKDTCTGYFDWSKSTSMLKFKIEEQNVKFKIAEVKNTFKIEQQNVKFKIEEQMFKFRIKEENIKFSVSSK